MRIQCTLCRVINLLDKPINCTRFYVGEAIVCLNLRAARETSKSQNWSHWTNSLRRYVAEILTIQVKLCNKSINQPITQGDFSQSLLSSKGTRAGTCICHIYKKASRCNITQNALLIHRISYMLKNSLTVSHTCLSEL